MTELDEALRALEKKWLAQAEDCEAQANRLGDQPVGREIMRDAAQYRQSAHQLAALLTTRQEVAPVAWPHPLGERHAAIEAALKGQTLLLMGRDHLNDKKKPLAEIKFGMSTDLGVLFCLADTEAPMPVDTSTGQTSDARDVPSRETLAGLLAAIYYAQWSTHEDKTRIERCVESALRNFDIGLNRFVPADEQEPAE